MTTPEPLLSLCAPAYNEAEGIARVVAAWEETLAGLAVTAEIVITNDGSSDGTLDILRGLQQQFANLVVVDQQPNAGYGRAVANAIAHSRGRQVLTLDSDGQFDPGEYPSLAARLNEGYDVVTGFRLRKRDKPARVLADRALNVIVRVMFGLPLRDTNCALKLWSGDVARSIPIEARGFPTPTEMLVKARALGRRIGEVGITHHPRLAGESKLKVVRTGWYFLLFLVYLRLKVTLYRWRVINSL
jgi:glycosyltransferase involved in cell wall biosynthesis